MSTQQALADISIRIKIGWGARVALSVKLPSLDFSSGQEWPVCEFEPCVGVCVDSSEPGAGFRFYDYPTPHCPSPTCALSHLVSTINVKKKI